MKHPLYQKIHNEVYGALERELVEFDKEQCIANKKTLPPKNDHVIQKIYI